MMRRAHAYQKTHFMATMDQVRDEYDRMDGQLSQLTAVYRNLMPQEVLAVTSFDQFDSFAKKLYERNQPFRKPYDEYVRMRARIVEVTRDVERHLLTPLLLVPSLVETQQQRELKQTIRDELALNHQRLARDFDWSTQTHAQYVDLIPTRDHAFFLGLVSVVALGCDTLFDVDQQLDEYWSGVEASIKLHD